MKPPARSVAPQPLPPRKPAVVEGDMEEVGEDLKEFAQLVNASAKSLLRQARRGGQHQRKWEGVVFGRAKVFICAVHEEMTRRVETRAKLPRFKQQLLRAQRAELVSLSRADLVEAMPPRAVRESELTVSDTWSFHFVRID